MTESEAGARCPVCYLPVWDGGNAPVVELDPRYCPARSRHEEIGRTLAFILSLDRDVPANRASADRAWKHLESLRTAP
jgi:hypothetical protein